MAKNDNLTDFLADVANAIREKKGTTEPINPQDFASEIASIETGGEGMQEDAAVKDVNFYDYDGTRLYSYSWDEIVAMTELPPLPTRKGLICQEWNYTLDDIKEQSHHKADVGANYTTDDGMTRMYINTLADNTEVSFFIRQKTGDEISGEWGDGTAITRIGATGDVKYTHTYAKSGAYVISIRIPEESYWDNYTENKYAGKTLRKLEIASGVSSIRHGVNEYCLKSISLPKTAISTYDINNGIYQNSYSLEALVMPQGSSFSHSGSLMYSGVKVVSFPNNMNFGSGNNLMYHFSECRRLDRVVLPQGLAGIGERMFYNARLLSDVAIPNSVGSIGTYAFYGCEKLKKLDFSHFTSIPSLSSSALPSEISTIVVPDELYDDWITRAYWKNYSSKFVKASEQ